VPVPAVSAQVVVRDRLGPAVHAELPEHVLDVRAHGLMADDQPRGDLGLGTPAASSGQRQRIALARALIRQTPILLLDEPTTGLDQATRTHVVEMLRDLRGATILIATHDPDLARIADRVITLEDGRVARGDREAMSSFAATNGASARYLVAIAGDSGPPLLIEKTGSAPAVGASLQGPDGRSWYVSELAPSPLPGDSRVCVYLRLEDAGSTAAAG
jgi:hypothetical protein